MSESSAPASDPADTGSRRITYIASLTGLNGTGRSEGSASTVEGAVESALDNVNRSKFPRTGTFSVKLTVKEDR